MLGSNGIAHLLCFVRIFSFILMGGPLSKLFHKLRSGNQLHCQFPICGCRHCLTRLDLVCNINRLTFPKAGITDVGLLQVGRLHAFIGQNQDAAIHRLALSGMGSRCVAIGEPSKISRQYAAILQPNDPVSPKPATSTISPFCRREDFRLPRKSSFPPIARFIGTIANACLGGLV